MLTITGRRPARGDDPEIYLKDALKVFVHSGRLARGKINIPFIFCRRFRKKVHGLSIVLREGMMGSVVCCFTLC